MALQHKDLHDEIREQNLKFKEMTLREKWAYFWEYYRVITFAIICGVIILISIIRSMIENSKETVLYASLINANHNYSYEQMEQDFADYLAVSLDEVFVTIDASFQMNSDLASQADLASTQKLMAMSAANQIDILAADVNTALSMANNGYFTDLRTVLSAEQLAQYEPYFIYYTFDPEADRAAAEEAGIPYEKAENGPFDTLDPVPVGISTEAFHGITEDMYYGMPAMLGICISSQHMENASAFLTFLEHYEVAQP